MVESGLDVLCRERLGLLRGRRVGVLCHPASVAGDLTHAVDRLIEAGVRPARLFGPEHGVRGEAQDMIGVSDDQDSRTGIPVVEPLRLDVRVAGAPARAPGRYRRAGHRPAGRRQPLLHVHLDDGAVDGGGVRGGRGGDRARSPEPAGRRRDRRWLGRRALPFLRGSLPGAGPPWPDDRRDCAPAGCRNDLGGGRPFRAPAGRRFDGDPDARVAAVDDVRRDGTALGDAVAQHADARHGAGLSGAVSVRGHEPVRRAGHHAPVRAGRRAVPGRLRLGRRGGARRGCACGRCRSGRLFTSSRADRAGVSSCT